MLEKESTGDEAKIQQRKALKKKIDAMIGNVTTNFHDLYTTRASMALCATLMVYMSHLSITTAYSCPNVYSNQEKQQVEELFGVSFRTAKRLFDEARSLAFYVRKEAQNQKNFEELWHTCTGVCHGELQTEISVETIGRPTCDVTCEPASGTIGVPASGTIGEPASGTIGEPASGTIGEPCGGSIGQMGDEVGGEARGETMDAGQHPTAEVINQTASRFLNEQETAPCTTEHGSSNPIGEQQQELQCVRAGAEPEEIDDLGQNQVVSSQPPSKTREKKKPCVFDVVIQRYQIPNKEEERKQQKEQREKERVEWLKNLLVKHGSVMTIRKISEEAKKELNWGSIGSIFKLVKKYFRSVHYRIMPYLTENHRNNRLMFAQAVGCRNNGHLYEKALEVYWDETTLVIHIDEKWYRSHRTNVRCLVLKGMPPPKIYIKSKTHIPQVMIFAAVCRPVVRNGETIYDGKILWFPLLVEGNYVRTSKYHKAGDPKYTPVPMDREMFMNCLKRTLQEVMTDKLRTAGIKNVILQVDNAGGHSGGKENSIYTKVFLPMQKYVEETYKDLFPDVNVMFIAQPPCSPDMNVLDLGAWTSIQCKVPPIVGDEGIDENAWAAQIVAQTKIAWDSWKSVEPLGNLFHKLRQIFRNVVETNGGNTFDLREKGEEEGYVVYDVEDEEDDDIIYPAVEWDPNAEQEDDDIVYPSAEAWKALSRDEEDRFFTMFIMIEEFIAQQKAAQAIAPAAPQEVPQASAELVTPEVPAQEESAAKEVQAVQEETASAAPEAPAVPEAAQDTTPEEASPEEAPSVESDLVFMNECAQLDYPEGQHEEAPLGSRPGDVSLIEQSVDVEATEAHDVASPQKRQHTSPRVETAELLSFYEKIHYT